MEEAHQHEVLQIGGAPLAPPDDVVGLREPACTATREPALAVPVAELAHHRRRGLPGKPSESHRFTASVFQHRLHTRVAEQASCGLRVDQPAFFHLGRAVVLQQLLNLSAKLMILAAGCVLRK